MPQIINTNIGSLNSQRHLNNTQSALSRSLERLSSGKRINSAKDDASGLGISERMTSQIRGMNQAIRNARDGISMSQTAEGALTTSGDMLQRIRELAVQSSNATNSSIDRQALQDEVGQLAAELNRIAQSTAFNGQKLLDGSMGAQNYQVGANAGELITSSGTNFQTNVYGTHRIKAEAADVRGVVGTVAGFDSSVTAGRAKFTSEAITISGRLGSATTLADTTGVMSAKDLAKQVNDLADKTGVTAQARTETLFKAGAVDTSYAYALRCENGTEVTVSFSIGANKDADGYAQAINAFNAQSSKTGVVAEYDVTNNGVKLVNAAGNDIMIASLAASTNTAAASTIQSYTTVGVSANTFALVKQTADPYMTVGIAKGVVTYDSEGSYALDMTATTTSSFGIQDETAVTITAGAVTGNSDLKSVASIDITNFDNAQLALSIVDQAINIVNKERARYGALQSRFESTISNLEVNVENTSNARSRIQDTDYAQETAELSRASILQQAGTAMLAQANQMPQSVLSLIG